MFSLLVARIPLIKQPNASSALFVDIERSDLASFSSGGAKLREKLLLQ
jgi:hypothetical protein